MKRLSSFLLTINQFYPPVIGGSEAGHLFKYMIKITVILITYQFRNIYHTHAWVIQQFAGFFNAYFGEVDGKIHARCWENRLDR